MEENLQIWSKSAVDPEVERYIKQVNQAFNHSQTHPTQTHFAMEIDNALMKAIEIGQVSTGTVITNADGDQLVLVPTDNGWTVEKIYDAQPAPKFHDRLIAFTSVESLVSYLQDFSDSHPNMRAYGNSKGITVVLDDDKGKQVGRNLFEASFNPNLTEEWKLWNKCSDQLVSQEDFANFIEENAEDIIEPDGAKMLEIVSTLQSLVRSEFKSAVTLGNGNRKLTFEESSSDRAGEHGELEIPSEFTIRLQIFENINTTVKLKAKFRYRRSRSGIQMGFKLIRPNNAIRAAMNTFANQFGADSGLMVHWIA